MRLNLTLSRNGRRRFGLLLLFFFWGCSALVYGQQQKVTLSGSNGITLKEAFNQIEKQTGLSVDYNAETLDDNRRLKPIPVAPTVDKLMNLLLKEADCQYVFRDGHIIISKQSKQTVRKVSGRIVDVNGEPIIGANVLEKGTSNGVITDIDGNYTLNVSGDAILQFSYIGFVNCEQKVAGKQVLDIVLREDTQTLDEVVVVGYGSQKKVNLTGAVETITSDVIEDRPIRSATDALQGTALGVSVTSAAGQPGSFSSIKIRGNSSLNSAGALVLIDGLPGDINQVNPQDIENISVLKDAAASAIYGSRAAEGVILVTTKQGSTSKTRIEYSANFSFNKPTRYPESTTGLEHARLTNLAFENAGLSPMYFPEDLKAIADPNIVSLPKGNDWQYTADVDWIDMMIDNTFQQQHNLTVSRSQDRMRYLISAGWLDQNGLFAEYGPDNFDRFNVRSNINVDLVEDKFNLDARIVFSRMDKKSAPVLRKTWSIPNMVLFCAPTMPIYDANGNYSRYRMQGNPIQALKEGGEVADYTNVLDGVFTLSYNPMKELTLKAVGAAKFTNKEVQEWRRAYGKYGPDGLISQGFGQGDPNSLRLRMANTRYFTGQLLAEYEKTFGAHDVKVLGGWSAEQEHYSMTEAKRVNIIGNELPSIDLGSTTGWTNDGDKTHWALLSGFMRLNYSYASKYLFEANFRVDGSSRFSDNNKWGFFPSFSLGWRVTEEEFMKQQQIFSNLKLRASWGQLGNQNGLGLYDHIPQYGTGGYYPFQKELAQWAYLSKLPSDTRTWETVEMKNIAVEMGFLDNRLTVIGEYFQKRNKDMLVNIEVPSAIGIAVPTGNYGELEVKGWEASVSWRDRFKDLNYYLTFTLSDRKDKLTDYGVEYSSITAGVNKKVQGYSIGSIFGFETDGYFQSSTEAQDAPAFNKAIQDAGDIRYIDQDKDGKISAPNDLVYLGTTQPRYEFSLLLGGDWKGFDFSALIQGVGKRSAYLDGETFKPYLYTYNNFSYTYYSDHWTPENRNALLPRLYAGSDHNYQISSHWIQNAMYMRLKNLQVGYTLNPEWTRKFKVEKLRFYFSGENLCEYSKLLKYYDPELDTQNDTMYPLMRNFSLGVNLVF